MSLSLLTQSRTVLMVSDEALYIYSVSGKGVKLVEAVPWGADGFEENVALVLSRDCGGKPVLIINDMVEQHYKKEKIPRVSVMDKQRVVQRKLQVAFPNYPARAALPLKEKIKKTESSLGGSIYIFAAVPGSQEFSKTMGAANRSMASLSGFCLLPVEASDMVQKLSLKLASKGEKKAKWTIFIGQHKNGSLRQIVVKDGELALTRMTPIVENDEDPALWARDIKQEFTATMSYLSRFGFDTNDGLNIILIANNNAGDMAEELIDTPCNFYSLTIEDAAKSLGLSLGHQDDLHHADILHAAWIGRKNKFILPLRAKEIDKVSLPRQATVLASLLLLLGAAFQGYQFVDYLQKVNISSEEAEVLESRRIKLDLQYQKEVKRKEDLGFDIKLIQSALTVHDELEKNQIKVLELLYNVGIALGRDMRIDRIEVSRVMPSGMRRIIRANTTPPLYIAKMQMTFPSSTDAQKGNEEVQALRAKLQKRLPSHIVKVTKLLEDYEYSEEIVVEAGDFQTKSSSQDYVAEIQIEGPSR